jgi:hypothetical protein
MKTLRLLCTLALLIGSAFAQLPKPYVEAGATAGSAGYGVGAIGKLGVDTESKHFVSNVFVDYQTAGKTGNTAPISAGHSRAAQGTAFYKFGNWYAGAGAGWNETLTVDYSKYSWHPEVGGGRDFFGDGYSWRFQAMYLRELNEYTRYPTLNTFTTPGGVGTYQAYTCKCASGVQGVDINAWLPSPAANHHFFAHVDMEPIFFHTTETDPYNTQAWAVAQKHQRDVATLFTLGFVARF